MLCKLRFERTNICVAILGSCLNFISDKHLKFRFQHTFMNSAVNFVKTYCTYTLFELFVWLTHD